MKPISIILSDPIPFLDNIFQTLSSLNIKVDKYQLDHVCYRTESTEQYLDLKTTLHKFGKLLTENQINGRPIATFKLFQPIIFKNRKIYLLELPSPKPGSFYPAGYEHVEFIIDESLEKFMARYPDIVFDKKGISKQVNPEVRLTFPEFSVKFHLHDLEYVIRYF